MKGFAAAQSRYEDLLPDDDETTDTLSIEGDEYIIMKVALAEAQTHIKEEIKRGDPFEYFAEQLSRNEEAFEILERYK